jgi:hypothetical protein
MKYLNEQTSSFLYVFISLSFSKKIQNISFKIMKL